MKRSAWPLNAALLAPLALLWCGAGEAIAARTLLADLMARAPVAADQPAARPVISGLALQACLTEAQALDRTGIAIDQQVLTVDRLAAEGLFLQNQINAKIPVLGGYDEKGLNDFQQRVIRREELAHKFETDFPVYQQAQKDYDAAVAEFERRCAAGFTADDLNAVKAKLGIK